MCNKYTTFYVSFSFIINQKIVEKITRDIYKIYVTAFVTFQYFMS